MKSIIAAAAICLSVAAGPAWAQSNHHNNNNHNNNNHNNNHNQNNHNNEVPSISGNIDISTRSIDNSIRQVAIMKDDVKVESVLSVRGNGNFATVSGSGNGSIGGGINVSAIGAANSISTTTTGAMRGGRP